MKNNIVNLKMPQSFNGMKALLLRKADQTKSRLKATIEILKYAPSITLDLWTDESMTNSYLGITIHFIKESALTSALLGIQ
jgi:hypothetical protein